MLDMDRQYVLKKIIYSLITIFAVLVFNYFLFRVMPGNPLQILMRNPNASAEAIEKTKELFGLNKPAHIQFFIYIKSLFQGDLGTSFLYKGQPVTEVIGSRILPTLLMIGAAEILAIITGIFIGVISAWKRGTKIDIISLSFSLISYSMPTFWIGIVFVTIFCVQFRIFPTSGMMTPGLSYSSFMGKSLDVIKHLTLPVLTMSLVLIGQYALVMRSTLVDVLTEDYITTAHAKGFKEDYVIKKHAVPNAMLPMVTLIAINLGLVIAGAIQIETIFSWPGIGRLMYDAIKNRDYPLLQGIFLLVTISVIIANLLADLTYGYLDPRVKSRS
jgi:peptide/nickel transport system permease protein